jgi:hypothetical protein
MAKNVIIKHRGKVVNGKRIYDNFNLHIESIHDLEGQRFEETIKLEHKSVSNDAHGYYRGGVLGECMDYELFRGWERAEIHEHFAGLYLSYKKHTKYIDKSENTSFKEETKTQSTADLSSKEMFEYCERCIQWCAERGIIIKTPEEYYLGKYKTKTVKL